ncbi:MAG: 5-formyltetrahydrofolate cyclo-ligase [Oscillospiraceae bacterium]|nr:5-formyltetrahydrofolate cyclo-ligase [Oscillospiraceae bacterium]
MEGKKDLRSSIRSEIEALPAQYISDSNEGIFRSVTAHGIFKDARAIMIYHSVGREPATLEIAKHALSGGKTVTFPRCLAGGIMHACAVRSLDELRPAVLGIPAPSEEAEVIAPSKLDLIIVPALTYDTDGYRLGYGGGYYDRYLPRTAAFTIGLARERLIKERLPREPHDIAVRCVMTEKGALPVASRT